MSFWSSATLRQKAGQIVVPAAGSTRLAEIEYGSYTLHVGCEIYITPHADGKDPQTQTKRILAEKECVSIPAGQFAFLLTEEDVQIPYDAIGFISMKAKTKFKGLVNVSGFHVDPGYKGKLVFSVFNAGPAPIHVQRGSPLFMLWISDLDKLATVDDARKPNKGAYSEIPVELINNIPGEIFSLQSLSKGLKEADEKLYKGLANADKRISNQDTKINVYLVFVGLLLTWFLRQNIAQDMGHLYRIIVGQENVPTATVPGPTTETDLILTAPVRVKITPDTVPEKSAAPADAAQSQPANAPAAAPPAGTSKKQ
jgi:dCTP deaminase